MPKTIINKQLLTNELLYLRYGSTEPTKNMPTLITIDNIAKLMK